MTRVAPATSALLLTACAGVNPQASFQDVQRAVSERTGQRTEWARSVTEAAAVEKAVADLLKEDLTPERAVQVAFLNNPALQATFEEIASLGIGEVLCVCAAPKFLGATAAPVRLTGVR